MYLIRLALWLGKHKLVCSAEHPVSFQCLKLYTILGRLILSVNPQLSRFHLLVQGQLYFFKTHLLEKDNMYKWQVTQARNQMFRAAEGHLKTGASKPVLFCFAYVQYCYGSSNSFFSQERPVVGKWKCSVLEISSFTPAHWVKKEQKAKSPSQFSFLPVKLTSRWGSFKIANIKGMSRL